jgi:methyltransferase-like protein/2-polyprenyl-3-methyl-5-hydroxy-6-metoxy-1,4-benzoquinol methylase/Fe-S-cluster containining protein
MTGQDSTKENQAPEAAEQTGQEWKTANVELAVGDRRLKAKVTVPAGPSRLRELLPVVQSLTDAAVRGGVEDVEARGLKVSCKKGCGACCRQLVPISPVEARHIHDLIEALPEPRRAEIKNRFAAARQRLEKAGMLEYLFHPETWPDEGGQDLGLTYFHLGIPCPFLEEESCSIYLERPLECRQYLVTSPAENCKNPTRETIRLVPLSMNPWRALSRVGQTGMPGEGKVPWVPLILAPEWVKGHPEEPPPRPGPELLQEVFENLTGKDLSHSWPGYQLLPRSPNAAPIRAEEGGTKSLPQELSQEKACNEPELGAPGSKSPLIPGPATCQTSYDEIPYLASPRYSTHPNCLATLATLLGMNPAPIDSCRVLELGCGTGGNLIPMALTLPQSHFVGVDLSSRQIASGRALADAIGLTNIELMPLSITDIDERFGQFDYIICHGVYSWVPPKVQDHLLTICKRNLAPHGVAHVSYNTYPGWHQRGLVRELLNYHVRQFGDTKVRTQQARAFLKFLIQSAVDPNSPYTRILKEEAELIRKEADWYVFHEHLEDYNEPLYFYQFMERAAAKGLQYLGEAWNHSYIQNLPPEVRDTLQQLSGDLLHLEQYVDFLRNRTFRQTLLCHQDVGLNRTPSPEILMKLMISSLARPMSANPNFAPEAPEEFRNDSETCLTTNKPLMKAALWSLYEAWPRALSFDDLWTEVQARLSQSPIEEALRGEPGRALLAKDLLQSYLTNMMALHGHVSRFALRVSDKPVASPLARYQARHQTAADIHITTLTHRKVKLDDLDLVILPLLDGSRDRAALVDALVNAVNEGSLTVHRKGQPAAPDQMRVILEASLEDCLNRLARFALLTE